MFIQRLILSIGLFLYLANALAADDITEISLGFEQSFVWREPETHHFQLRADRALLVVIEAQGFPVQAQGFSLLGRDDLTLDAQAGYIAWDYFALTEAEAADFRFTISQSFSYSSLAAFKISVREVTRDEWRFYRLLTLGSLRGQDIDPKIVTCADEQIHANHTVNCFTAAKHLARQLDPARQALANHYLGTAYFNNRELQKALPLFRQSVSLSHQQPHLQALASAWMISILRTRGAEEELKLLHENSRLARRLIDDYPNNIGFRYLQNDFANGACLFAHNRNQLEQAETCYREVLARATAYPGHATLHYFLNNNLAGVALQAGKTDLAKNIWHELIQSKSEYIDSSAYNNLAIALNRLGQPESAITYFEQAVELVDQELSNPDAQVNLRRNLAAAYYEVNRMGRARHYLRQAVDLADQHQLTNWAFLLQIIQSKYALSEGNHQLASKHMLRADAQLAGITHHEYLIRYYLFKAHLLVKLHEYDGARETLQTMTEHIGAPKIPIRQANYQRILGELSLQTGRFSHARQHLNDAVSLYRETGASELQAKTLQLLAELFARQGEMPASLVAIEAAQELMQQSRRELKNIETRAYFSRIQRNVTSAAVDLYVDEYTRTADSEYALRAFATVENFKGQSIREQRSLQTGHSLLPELRSQRLQLSRRLSGAAATRYVYMSDSRTDPTLLRISEQQYIEALRALERFDEEHLPALEAQQKAVQVEQLQSKLKPDQLYLSYLVTDAALVRFEVTQNDFAMHVLPRSEIRSMIKRLVNKARSPDGYLSAEFASARRYLDLRLIPDAALLGKHSSLLISADEWLWDLPFALLTSSSTSPRGTNWLSNTHQITLIPALVIDTQEQLVELGEAEGALVFADPVFSSSGISMLRSATNDSIRLDRLPGTQREARVLADYLPSKISLFQGAEATRSRLFDALSKPFNIVHIATHGLFAEAHSGFSGLALSMYDSNQQPIEWLVTQQDIYATPVNAGLVFLSACESGRGDAAAGEGVVGITRAFLASGAREVIATNWKISDRATYEWVKSFYTAKIRDGMGSAAALAATQRFLSRSARYGDPYYWAGFMLYGRGIE